MKTTSKKAKGRLGQQEVRDRLLKEFPQLEPDDIQSTAMGQSGSDLKLSPAARKLIPISPEIKRRKKGFTNLYEWLKQAATGGKYTPTLFIRQDFKDWLVIIDFDTYIDLLKGKK